MRREELIAELNKKNIPEGIYSLNGIKDGECLCIVKEDSTWDVVYNSRGKITYKQSFNNEEQAYSHFYQIMKEDYGW